MSAPVGDAVVALDVGGTVMKGWVCDRDGRALRRVDRDTPAADGPDAVVAAIRSCVAELADGSDSLVAAGVVVPGIVDARRGVASYSANLGWRDVPLRDLIAGDLDLPVALDHDVRAGGLAEYRLGAAAGASNVLFVPVGTGIAGAVLLDGTPLTGANGSAGEIGHVVVHPGGEVCGCGQQGCVEAYASASSIARRYRQATGRTATAHDVAGLLARDADARRVWDDAVEALALGLVACTMLLDPERIVLGGGLAGAGDVLLDPLSRRLYALLPWHPAPPIVPAALGAAAGRYGAGILGFAAAGVDVGDGWRP